MSQHRSLKGASTITAKRNVLKRFERVELLKKRGQFKQGQKVLFGKYSGAEITLDDEEVLIIKESDVLAVIGVRAQFLVELFNTLVHVRCRGCLLTGLIESNADAHQIERWGWRALVPQRAVLAILQDPVQAPLRAFQVILPVASFGVDIRHLLVYAAGVIESKSYLIVGVPGLLGEVRGGLVNGQSFVVSSHDVQQGRFLHRALDERELALERERSSLL